MINIKGINKYFNKGKQNEIHVINDVTLQLPEKGMVAMFGKSGCGKTTLLNVIGGLDGFASGSVEILGENIKRNTDTIRNKYIGYIFQNYNLNKEISCFDNVADALRLCGITDKDEIERRVCAALANVDMEKYKKRTPDTLSGGQQQRIAIARAIVKNPKIILADEPTGNLDEANTVKIMNLLKAISQDHLVIIVTHEANLVDYYCDTVIELADGKVVNVRQNEKTFGFKAKDKNTIYLGELEKRELRSDDAAVSYYGAAADKPIAIKIINSGGKLYLSLDTPDVHVLDSSSEIKLDDGVYKEETNEAFDAETVDMSSLPPINGNNFGKLFTLASSVRSGITSNFKTKKRGAKLLRRCMIVFAVTLVFMSSVFGTSIDKILNASDSNNHNVFYVYTDNAATSQALYDAYANGKHGVDSIQIKNSMWAGDEDITFKCANFETFNSYSADSLETNAVFLEHSLASSLPLIAGKNTDLAENEIVITAKVADKLLEISNVSYISERDDLIGLLTSSLNGTTMRIAGIVDSTETAAYFAPYPLARRAVLQTMSIVKADSDYDFKVKPGTVVILNNYQDKETDIPLAGDTIKLRGLPFEVDKVMNAGASYSEWLKANGITKPTRDEYYAEMQAQGISNVNYFEYLDVYYSELDAYLSDRRHGGDTIELWAYFDLGRTDIKYTIIGEYEYFIASKFKEDNGVYPAEEYIFEHPEIIEAYGPLWDEMMYFSESEYDAFYSNAEIYVSALTVVVGLDDYIKLSKRTGETNITRSSASGAVSEPYAKDDVAFYNYSAAGVYTVIHSNDVKQTEAWLKENFSSLENFEYSPYDSAVVTPKDLFDAETKDNITVIVSGLIAVAVLLVIMSVCMYFIMRSSLMNKIKEVGIYRAIGVSKRNIKFKFFIEANVLAITTVFVGYLLSSIFLIMCTTSSSLMSSVFFYPIWYALAILIVLYIVCIVCATLPITSLLKKTPSEILAKYDI